MKKVLKTVLILFFAAIFIVSAALLGMLYLSNLREREISESVSGLIVDVSPTPEQTAAQTAAPEPTPTPVLEKYSEVYAQNNETIGWVTINDSVIDYVVMQTPDDPEKYLHIDYFGNYSGNGTLFLDYRDDIWTSDNLIVYGHHMKDGDMFGTLIYFAQEGWWQTRRYITFDTIYEERTYEIIGAFYARLLNSDEEGFRYYDFIDAQSEEEFNEYMDFIEANRCYDTGVTAEYGDQLLTLSTCAYHTTNGRFAVVAKLISDSEVNTTAG